MVQADQLERGAAGGVPPAPRTRAADAGWRIILHGAAAIGLIMLVVPTLIIIITSFDTRNFIGFPPAGFALERFDRLVHDQAIIDAAITSLSVAVAAVLLDVVLAVPAAIAFVRREFAGKSFLLAFLQIPLMLPGIVIGIALLIFISTVGIDLSLGMLVLGHVVLTFPFVLRITMSRMERADIALEEAARNLGASRLVVFGRIQLPYLAPGIVAGAAFAFLSSFDNLTVSLFLTPVGDMTLPVHLFFLMRYDLDPVVAAVATVQVLATLTIIVVGLRVAGEDAIVST
ncbi:MAG: ABC transporter permease [Bifidobacteriaceae bacterium]|jgi:putative spermidine/putrescine transport system permease protein|nr:ABC transporter permease [Bifidobacteriaceae bacterium]